VKRKLEQLGKRILTNARNELYLSMRFLDTALGRFRYEINLQTFYVGCDGVTLYFNPKFLAERFANQKVYVNRTYLHMVLHCLFMHVIPESEVEEERWNLACDIVIEFIIDSLDCKATNLMISDYRLEWYGYFEKRLKVLTAEGVYHLLKCEDIQPSQMVKLQAAFLVDDHQFWKYNKERENNEWNNTNFSQEQKVVLEFWKKISEKTKTNLETFSKSAGQEMMSLTKALQVQNRERYDYKSFLRRFAVLSEENKVDQESFDYGLYMYGLNLYENMPLIEPLEYREVQKIKEFIIAIDTSGSCSGQLVHNFLEETVNILLDCSSFHEKACIHIIQCDNQIQQDVVINQKSDLESYQKHLKICGHGGTDFRPVFEYVDKLIEEKKINSPKGLIYFTDGYGVFPKRRPCYDVAFAFFRDDYSDAEVPPWAIKIIIDSNGLE